MPAAADPPLLPDTTRRRWLHAGLAWPAALGAAFCAHASPPAAPTPAAVPTRRGEAAKLHAMFDAQWEETARMFPEWATWRGDHRYGDRLMDQSPAAILARQEADRRWLARARRIRRDRLDSTDRVSLDVFIHTLQVRVDGQAHEGWNTMTLGALGGFDTELAELADVVPMRDVGQVEQWLARLAAYPARVDQEIAQWRRGIALRWVPAQPVLQRTLQRLDRMLAPAAEATPFAEPLTRFGDNVPVAAREGLRTRGLQSIDQHVRPALRRLRDFIAGDYLGAAPVSGAMNGYPGGEATYRHQIAENTTLSFTADELHALGLREVARLREAMASVQREVGFDGSFAAFVEHLNADPKFFHASPEAMLDGYRAIAKRIDPEMPALFAVLPRTPYGIRGMPGHADAHQAEYYNGPPLDGSRPGWFSANLLAYRTRPTWTMPTLVAHEAVPGHHLQGARAVEMGELPAFRRALGVTAYWEGWALYAELLGNEFGLYANPYDRFGHLQWQLVRAVRLVVDTGLHARGWTRQAGIDYMAERTGLDLGQVTSEVDRYTAWPGQALAYWVGMAKIVELRQRGRARLGERFDLRRFHNVVLDVGSVPLPVLERVVDEWIAAQGGTALARG